MSLENRIPTLALRRFSKSLFFWGLSFLIWKIRGLDDWVLSFAISLTQSSQGLSPLFLRFSNVISSRRSTWITKLMYFPQPPSAVTFSVPFLWFIFLKPLTTTKVTFLLIWFLVSLFQPSCLQYKCHWEQETCLFLHFYTIFTIWKSFPSHCIWSVLEKSGVGWTHINERLRGIVA